MQLVASTARAARRGRGRHSVKMEKTGAGSATSRSQQRCTDGSNPSAGLINLKGTLYGTRYSGGSSCEGGCGTVFALKP